MGTLASYSDVETALGRPLNSSERQQVDWWLGGVEMHIAARLGPVAALDPNAVRYVEAEAVAGKVRRGGIAESSITVSVDDGSVTRRYPDSVAASDITDDMWALITPATSLGAFTMRTGLPREFNFYGPGVL